MKFTSVGFGTTLKKNEVSHFTYGHLILVVLLHLISSNAITQELVISGQNETRYAWRGDGDLRKSSENWGYFENDLEVDLSYHQVRLHLRQRYLMPSEFGLKQTGWDAIDKKYIEFQNDMLTLRGGDFYRQWGRGLFLGMNEVKEINYDSGLEGLYGEFRWGNWEGALFRGQEIDTARTIQESATGGYINLLLTPEMSPYIWKFPIQLRLGLSLIHFDSTSRHWAFDRRCLEGELGWDGGSFYTAYFLDSPDYYSKTRYRGFYAATELYGSGWGILVDYRNYKFPPFSQPSLQYPPSGVPEVTFYLFDRYPWTPDYTNEVSYQIEANYKQGYHTLKWNFHQISRQENLNVLPSLRENLMPYWSTSFALDQKVIRGWRWGISGGYLNQRRFAERYGGGIINEWREGRTISIGSEMQYLWNIEKRQGRRFRDIFLSTYGTYAPVGTLTIIIERSGDEWDFSGAKPSKRMYRKILGRESYWPSVELALTGLSKTQLRIFYGYERGGIKCSGGLCRPVYPFKGIKATLTVQF